MPKLEPYARHLPYSYALGLYPASCCLSARPDLCRRLLLSSRAADSEGAAALQQRAEAAGVRVELADRLLGRLSHKENVFAAMVFTKEEASLDPAAPHVVLDGPGDAGNLGTILRTCLGLGIRDVALLRPAVDAFEPHAVRASMGALFSVRLSYFQDFAEYRQTFMDHALYPFMLEGSTPLSHVAPPEGLWALIFGNEARGLSQDYLHRGQPVRIEQSPAVDSLNLSVAVALGVYCFLHKDKGGTHGS